MKKLLAPLSVLSIFFTAVMVMPAQAGTRDGGNGPVYLKCSELSGLSFHERKQREAGERIRCIPDNSENPVPEDHGPDDDSSMKD